MAVKTERETYTINKFNKVTIDWLALYVKVTNLRFASEQMHAAELSQLRTLLSSDDSVSEVMQSRSLYRSLPPRPICRMLTQRRCRSIAVHHRRRQFLWVPTTLEDDGLTGLPVTSLWLKWTSCWFPVTLLVLDWGDHSTLQVLTTSHVVFITLFIEGLLQ